MSSTARPCSIAGALQIVGERWALLAVREIMFGNRRFDEIARNTGASRDILTARLRSLEATGVLTRRLYQDRPARYEYHLTEAGRDLAPVLTALRDWGDHWLPGPPPVTATHTCGHPAETVPTCAHCHEKATPETLRLTVTAPGWTLKGPE
ncbi:HxlR family transcriptional regulator [Actinocorallia herbida]|uniref:HxlR family transcriptional regulator n=1 Tax=Actinocorallia herbida TaxID=58109 RepID=A0A3N1D4B9_9ACTN|nr:helix-turn-helix domain-containing protein [Actinocorallia herbida]ROO88375.1 HxlR family transcriptional regulator [Actinocorallia herbida]